MGFFDTAMNSIKGAANRGGAAAQRAARTMSIQSELGSLQQRKMVANAEFGASVYAALEAFPELREGREALIENIASIDARRVELEAELAQIAAESEEAAREREAAVSQARESMGAAVAQARESVGSAVSKTRESVSSYTSGLAASAATTTVPEGMFVCPKCGELVAFEDRFCMGCGTPVADIMPVQAPDADAEPAAQTPEE